MSDTTKFLYLDPTESAAPSAPAEQEDTPCPCCEASLNEIIDTIRHSGQDRKSVV